jgi:hypothetical protein
LRRWIKQHRYGLNETALKIWCYNRKTGQMQRSLLNLVHCFQLRNTESGVSFRAIVIPGNLERSTIENMF